jgi:hypothetical protein
MEKQRGRESEKRKNRKGKKTVRGREGKGKWEITRKKE